MARIPSYVDLNPEDQEVCRQWNSSITAVSHLPALANPPTYLKLFQDGYDTYEELKEDMDDATRSAGFITKIKDSGSGYKTLVCNRGASRPSVATKRESTTIKVGCQWRATASCNKSTCGKWKLIIKHGEHANHGPQTDGASARGWMRLTPKQAEFAAQLMRDPTISRKRLEAELLRAWPGLQLGKSTIKCFMQQHRSAKTNGQVQDPAAMNTQEGNGGLLPSSAGAVLQNNLPELLPKPDGWMSEGLP